MFQILILALSLWLAFKVFGLALRLTWGAAKVVGLLRSAVALPLLIGCLLFAGGLLLLLPVLLLGAAAGIMRAVL